MDTWPRKAVSNKRYFAGEALNIAPNGTHREFQLRLVRSRFTAAIQTSPHAYKTAFSE
jgi:hypothetical protein